MQPFRLFSRRAGLVAGVVAALLVIGGAFAFEPVTRNLVANNDLCTYCHLEWEFDPTVRLSLSRPMKATPDGDDLAQCVDCHVPEGISGSLYAWLHFASITDFFGHFRDLETERAGTYLPPRAITAYRTRDRLYQYDSITCRGCHAEDEIKLSTAGGREAHKLAREEKMTCIECHINLVHRRVDRRPTAFGYGTASDAPSEGKP